MATGLVTHDQGYLEMLRGDRPFPSVALTAVLVTNDQIPDRVAETEFGHISANESPSEDYSRQAVAGKAVTLDETDVRFTCGKMIFTPSGNVVARYIYFVFGEPQNLQANSRILGHIDMVGADKNAESINAEFSHTPDPNGLMRIPRPVLV